MLWLPNVRLDVVMLTVPPLTATGAPMELPSAKNSTKPLLPGEAVIVAVNVTAEPLTEGLEDETKFVDVAVGEGLQVLNLKEAIRVRQLKVPLAGIYSVVYQSVQSSTGSTVRAL